MSNARTPTLPGARLVDEILPEHLVSGLLNIVVFGPGRGEAILVMLPDGSLGVVDGCREPADDDGRGDPVRELLDRLHARDVDIRLRFVCLTHPHDDHYAGLGRLLRAFEGRVDEVWSPFAAGDRYAQAYLEYQKLKREPSTQQDWETLRGLDRAFAELQRLHTDTTPRPRVFADKHELLRAKMGNRWAVISSLGPSARDTREAQLALTHRLQGLKEPVIGSARPDFDPNEASGALLVRWGKARVLLAGDLTRGADPLRGWNNVHRFSYIDGPVQVINVAHHASAGAHHDELWAAMSPRLAIVTPFKNGKDPQPPRPRDIHRLLDSGAQVIITARPHWNWDGSREPLPQPDRATETAPRRLRTPKASVLAKTPAPGHHARRNAVAVALSHQGAIRCITLAGEASFYRRG